MVQQLAHDASIPLSSAGAGSAAGGAEYTWIRMAQLRRVGAGLAVLALVVALAALPAVLLAGPGSRMGWWSFRTGLTVVLAWAANLGSVEFHPWPVRRPKVDHPDELRIDLDPQPGTR